MRPQNYWQPDWLASHIISAILTTINTIKWKCSKYKLKSKNNSHNYVQSIQSDFYWWFPAISNWKIVHCEIGVQTWAGWPHYILLILVRFMFLIIKIFQTLSNFYSSRLNSSSLVRIIINNAQKWGVRRDSRIFQVQ